jgi:hypothetical protein
MKRAIPIHIPMTETKSGRALESEHTLRLPGGLYRFGIGAVPLGGEGRKVCGGPLVRGPWAYAVSLCRVLDDDATSPVVEHEVVNGSLLRIDAETYKVCVYGREHIELVRVCPGCGVPRADERFAGHAIFCEEV